MRFTDPVPDDRHELAAIVPIDSARKPRTAARLAADVHNAGIEMRFDHGRTPSSRKWAELWQRDTCIARDPMPSIGAFDGDGVLVQRPVEIPGPNCLDKISEVLGLTDAERALFRTRREDAEILLAEHIAASRNGLEPA